MAWRTSASGVGEQGAHAQGITQEPGRPSRFRGEGTGGGKGTGQTKSPGPRAQRLVLVGAKNETRRGTALARETRAKREDRKGVGAPQ